MAAGILAAMLRLTLDTNCIIHAAQAQHYGPQVDELAEHGRVGRVGLWITTAFKVDQDRASDDNRQRNLAWLSQRPTIGTIPGPWRVGYSGLEGPDGFTDPDHADADLALREIILPEELQRGRLDEHDPAQLARNRRKVTDVQHLTAHLMAGHDAFVTDDHDDMLDNVDAIRRRTGIVVIDPAEAVQLVQGQDADQLQRRPS
jgi:uncharacterized membrane-anchored protein